MFFFLRHPVHFHLIILTTLQTETNTTIIHIVILIFSNPSWFNLLSYKNSVPVAFSQRDSVLQLQSLRFNWTHYKCAVLDKTAIMSERTLLVNAGAEKAKTRTSADTETVRQSV